MGQRGPSPTPTSVLKARGSRIRKNRKDEPAPVPGDPICPDWLDDLAKEEWARVIVELKEIGCLSRTDRATIIGYCQAFAEFQFATQTLQKEGRYFTNQFDEVKKHPAIAVQQMNLQKMKLFAQELGLSPASRSRMPKSEKPVVSEDDGVRKR